MEDQLNTKKLISLVKQMGLKKVRDILEQEYHSQERFAALFEDLLDINGKFSPKIYENMVTAKSVGKKFIIPIFDPPHVPLVTNVPFRIETKDTDEWIKHLTGHDKVIWRKYNLFLVGHIPTFYVVKSIKRLEVHKDGDKYIMKTQNYEGYNPILGNTALKKYYRIYGHRMTCIVFDITYYHPHDYPDGIYDYGSSYSQSSSYGFSGSIGSMEYGDDGYETP